ncbi:L-glutamyl-[BtrI acyl-carrier protein] decarboxylase [Streptomyces sp. RB5]|uniref:L-glutamyl-[BtrI acyl-carrier protein] decarboxylase n=1 Tax=Streptomyces smaragdinus TaxID=2585196 RepID=A0A7K0CMR1_9ACTN|nr:type III PLP-dependent enzyme [Streptomyces smaragdinus]MQY14768.1 L-glutamyl-[BtrI acyl-carrier protein] decarboxylase [Streptomyces smaragdinus]
MMFATHIQGLALSELAEEYGTPLYLYDGDRLRDQYRGLRDRLHPAIRIFYSLKANPNLAITQSLLELGAGLELSSMAELATAQRAGATGDSLLFLGPGKSRDEIAAVLKTGARLIAESLPELDLIDEEARHQGVTAEVLLRVNPAFELKGGGLTMGGKPRQFGIDEETLLALDPAALRYGNLRVRGVQAYMGTRILDESAIVQNTRGIFDLAIRLSVKLGFELATVDVGGGLGVAYHSKERDLDVATLTDGLNPVIDEFHTAHPDTRLVMELGRFLAAPAGVYVTRVRYTKESRGDRFAICDGGTNHHMAAVGIGSPFRRNFPMYRVGSTAGDETAAWNVTGPLCTPNDTLAKAVDLPAGLTAGDLIGVTRSGAYGPTASPVLFLSHGYPAEVLVRDGRAHLVRRRDTVDDLLDRQSGLT